MKLSTLQKLAKLRAEADAIESQWAKQTTALLALPAKVGYRSISELRMALAILERDPSKPSAQRGFHRKRKTRVQITPDIERSVKELASAEKTGREIASKLDLSIATVQNIKRRLGLAKRRRPAGR